MRSYETMICKPSLLKSVRLLECLNWDVLFNFPIDRNGGFWYFGIVGESEIPFVAEFALFRRFNLLQHQMNIGGTNDDFAQSNLDDCRRFFNYFNRGGSQLRRRAATGKLAACQFQNHGTSYRRGVDKYFLGRLLLELSITARTAACSFWLSATNGQKFEIWPSWPMKTGLNFLTPWLPVEEPIQSTGKQSNMIMIFLGTKTGPAIRSPGKSNSKGTSSSSLRPQPQLRREMGSSPLRNWLGKRWSSFQRILLQSE